MDIRNPYLILDVETGIEENTCSGPGGSANPYAGVPLVMVGWLRSWHTRPSIEYWDGPGTRPCLIGLLAELGDLEGDHATIVVGHNVNFDLHHVLRKHSTEDAMETLGNVTIWDTQTAEFLLSGQYTKNAKLVDLERVYLGGAGRAIEKDEMSSLFQAGIGSDKIDKVKLGIYLEDDLRQTERVFLAQFAKAHKLGMLGFIREMMDAQMYAFLMEKEGMPIAPERIPEIVAAAEVELESAEEDLAQLPPSLLEGDTTHLNGVTNHQLAQMLVGYPIQVKWKEENGVFKSGLRVGQIKYSWCTVELTCAPPPIDVRTLQGVEAPKLPSTSEKSLERISANLPDGVWKNVFSAVVNVRGAEKKCNTYAKGYLSKVCSDNKLRTSLNNSTAVTNRVSSSNPNLQNLPGGM